MTAVAWLVVIVAGLFETGFAVLPEESQGITRPRPAAGLAICALISSGPLTMALKRPGVIGLNLSGVNPP